MEPRGSGRLRQLLPGCLACSMFMSPGWEAEEWVFIMVVCVPEVAVSFVSGESSFLSCEVNSVK